MTAEVLDARHPVAATVASVRADLAGVVSTPVWSMSATETGSALVAVTQLAAQVAQLQLRLLAHADRVEVGQAVGATSAATAGCHVHHDRPWSQGGDTDLKTGRLLCPPHHALAHDRCYQSTSTPDGKVAFHRRC